MFEILEKKVLSPEVSLIRISAPDIARRVKAGQFVIIRIDERGERIPLTVADFDRGEGTLTIIFQEVGKTTKHLASLSEGTLLADVVGPLGHPTKIGNYGCVICVAGGVGAAHIYPVTRAFKNAGNHVITILGARSANLLVWEDELKMASDELYITTDDGSKGRHGLVTDALRDLLQEKKVDLVMAVGPAIMMKFVCKTTLDFGVKTMVSLNPIMVDGTGMCGACRVSVGGETKFCCVDGPDFDGHQVDFDLLIARQRMYLEEEKIALEHYAKRSDN
ncbi:MAG: sulfide/dihydroorotate dehydrogenase-like FAD/NAD-binding protein [Actinomycetota bacterium]|nr:sulfide/dihydroorotate dehydrogenase-like FAD/NAD-binding protein [Actinomycetota bacterium]MDI6822688.1 sulfide/dihydroorotate dehydrogenase-like FAD/NAD-binding protein [Actinomycetota bacterium]